MTQTQMTAYLADKIGISKRQAKSALDELNELVTRQLKKEGLLRLAGLGVFRKRKLQGAHGPQPGHWRADQDSGTDPFTLHTGEGTERLRTRRPLARLTGETFCAPGQATGVWGSKVRALSPCTRGAQSCPCT